MLDIADDRKIVEMRHQKLHMLARAQLRPLIAVQKTVKIIGVIQGSPKLLVDLLAHGPKHPVRDKFTRMHFQTYADKLLVDLNNADPEVINEINSRSTEYENAMKQFKTEQWSGLVSISKSMTPDEAHGRQQHTYGFFEL